MAENLKRETKIGLYWKFFEQFANYGMQFVVGIVMARLLTPSDYGITALPAVFLSIASVFIESGFSSALVRKKDLTDRDLCTSLYYSFMVGIACYAILFITAPYIADFYDTPILKSLVRITALSFLWAPLNTPQNVILQRNLDFKTVARISITNKIISAIIGISIAYLGYGLWALVVSGLTSSFLGFVQTWFAVKWIPKERWSKESFKYLWGYGNKLVLTSLIDTLYNNIGPIFIAKFGNTVDLGNYNRAKNYASIPSSNMTGVLTSVTFPVLNKMQDDSERLGRNYRKMIRASAYVIFPVMLMLAGLARPLVLIMLTRKWENCIILLQILCFVFMWQPIHILNMNVLQVKGRTDLTLKLELIKKPLGTILLIIGLKIGVVYFCFADLLNSLIVLALNTFYTGKLINVGYFKQMRDIFPIFILSFVMFLSILFVISLISNLWIQLLAGFVVGVVVYLGGTLIFKFDEINDVKYMLQRNH